MTTLASTETTGQFSADVLALAARYDVAAYLQPLVEAARRLFPTVRRLRIYTEKDPELHEVVFLVIELEVPAVDIPDYVQAKKTWYDEFHRIVPPPYNCPFVFALDTVD